MSVTISLCDNFEWDEYVKEVYEKIINRDDRVIVTWDLTKFTKPPKQHFMKQILLMHKLRKKLRENIDYCIVRLKNKECYELSKLIFKYYTPDRPVEIIYE